WDRFAEEAIPDPAHPAVPDAAVDPHSHRLRTMCGFDQRDPGIEDVRRARTAYYAAVNDIADHNGAIRRRRDDLDRAKNTVITATSDHGDMLGEKGLWFKMSPYERSSRVPLIIDGPADVVTPGRYANPVSLIDLAPTLLEIAGCGGASAGESGSTPASAVAPTSAPAVGEGLAGTSLLASARRRAAGERGPTDRDVVLEYFAESTYRPQVTLVRGDCKVTLCPGDPELLFDLSVDPDELSNRAGDPAYTETLAAMREELESRYDIEHLEDHVLDSQRSRQLVADALRLGTVRHWDFDPEPEHGYVRGDFWSAFRFGKIPAAD